MSLTSNLSKFTRLQLHKLSKLLDALYEQGLPKDFYESNVTAVLNTHSNIVFLTNTEHQVARLDSDGKLKSDITSVITATKVL